MTTRRVVMLGIFALAACGPHEDNVVENASSADALSTATQNKLNAFMLAKMKVAQVPGMAVVAVKRGEIVFSHAYGMANIEEQRPVTLDTLFDVASISKTVTAAALMQSVEQAKVGLDEDVNDVLPFTVENPSYPSTAITPRMLLSHTSSIHDSALLYDYVVYDEDSPIPLASFMRGYLQPGGKYYGAANWRSTAPGASYQYSNAGVDLAGELVESLVHVGAPAGNLQTYCESNIFAPLAMTNSSWFLSGLDPSDIAMPYEAGTSGQYGALGLYCYPDYPNGQLRTSASQLARFLMMMIGKGTLGTKRVLEAATVAEMLTQQPHSEEGLSWEYFTLGGHAVVGHSGVDLGVSTDMWFDPATGVGFLVLTNGDVYDAHYANFESSGPYVAPVQAMIDIGTELLDLAESH